MAAALLSARPTQEPHLTPCKHQVRYFSLETWHWNTAVPSSSDTDFHCLVGSWAPVRRYVPRGGASVWGRDSAPDCDTADIVADGKAGSFVDECGHFYKPLQVRTKCRFACRASICISQESCCAPHFLRPPQCAPPLIINWTETIQQANRCICLITFTPPPPPPPPPPGRPRGGFGCLAVQHQPFQNFMGVVVMSSCGRSLSWSGTPHGPFLGNEAMHAQHLLSS